MPVRVEITGKGGDESVDELDIHVEDILRRRDKLRRSLQGLWAYLKTPIGIITGVCLCCGY